MKVVVSYHYLLANLEHLVSDGIIVSIIFEMFFESLLVVGGPRRHNHSVG